jgi:putative ABC transport system permease protein
MIIAVMTMNRQISHMINADRGYDDSNLLQVNMNYTERPNQEGQISGDGERMLNLMKNELAQSPSINYVTGKSRGLSMTMMLSMNEETGERQQVRTFMERADPDFFKALDMEILEGRNFELANGESERDYIIVNQQFAKKMNWGDSVLGRRFGFDNSQQEVIGLVKDYNFQSLESEIDPIVVNLRKDQSIGTLLIKFKEGTLAQSIQAVEAAWNKFNPVVPFEYNLLSEVNANQYGNQKRWRSILVTASLIAIAISCLGLFGLAYMATQRRTKEIGVRKVLGAPVPKIIFILSRNFSALVLISFIIACPLAYYGAEEWLSTFPYRIGMEWDMFLIAGLVTMTVAILTVSFHAVKTAIANPVKALRYE